MTGKIRAAVGDSFLLGVRVSAYEGIRGGCGTAGPDEVIEDLREPIALSKMIEEIRMDYVSVSGGSADANLEILLPTDKYPEGTFRHFGWAKAIKKAVSIPVIGSGYSYLRDGENSLKEPDPSKKSFIYWAEKNLRDGNVDLVGIGRQSLADPLFPKKILSGDEIHSVHFCTACGGCGMLLGAQEEAGCTVYDDYYRKLLRAVKKESKG
jgi:2,4-dienoyl-CoA reductase-like NADH-dependent reductase (Old Yellow Enzyme family)